jgi:hypothetical protein
MSEEQPGASHRDVPILRIFMTRLIVLILALIIAAGTPAPARCCPLGGGASYDYLGDSSMDIGMSSYDEFLRDNAPNSSVSADPAPYQKSANSRSMKLNLSDGESIDLQIESTDVSLAGIGNLTRNKEIGPVEAEGILQERILALNITAPGGEVYRLGLVIDGSRISGEYRLDLPDGEGINGTAEGWWIL